MKYSVIVEVFRKLEETSKGLVKTTIIAEFLDKIEDNPEFIYLIQGRVFPDYDVRELGVSTQIVIKALSKSSGLSDREIVRRFKELGDLGKVAYDLIKDKKQQTVLFSNELTVEKVMNSLRKISQIEGKGSIEQKINLIIELLNSSSAEEAKYIVRTLLSDLKIGVGSGIIRDAIVEKCFKPSSMEEKKKFINKVQEAYDKSNDLALVFSYALKGMLEKIELRADRLVKVMLFPKAKDIQDAFRIVGRPAAFEYKYDGFRATIHKFNDSIKIFTRRQEEVTKQFPDIVSSVKRYVKGKSFIIDSEVVGYDRKSKEYTKFQAISQRIKRKYGIEKMVRELPVELKVFDIIFYNGKSLINEEFIKRRELLEKIVTQIPKKIVLSKKLISDNEKEVETFYEAALKENQEGLMAKNLRAPYKPGSRIGYGVKIKPEDKEFDLVITGAEWGTGKRAGWLTSFHVSCRDKDGLKEIGKVSTGLKELREQGLSYEELTEKLKDYIIESHGRYVKVKPELVVTVQYQNIQVSPTYSSGFALRFPKIKLLRPDRGVNDIATKEEIKKAFKREKMKKL